MKRNICVGATCGFISGIALLATLYLLLAEPALCRRQVMAIQGKELLRDPAQAKELLQEQQITTTPESISQKKIIVNSYEPYSYDWELDEFQHKLNISQGWEVQAVLANEKLWKQEQTRKAAEEIR